jgi:hypothetical protein
LLKVVALNGESIGARAVPFNNKFANAVEIFIYVAKQEVDIIS